MSGCTADSNGNGTSARYSAGVYVEGQGISLDIASYQRSGGGGQQMYGLYLGSGSDYLIASVGQRAQRLLSVRVRCIRNGGNTLHHYVALTAAVIQEGLLRQASTWP